MRLAAVACLFLAGAAEGAGAGEGFPATAGALRGVVRDESGLTLPGVRVEVERVDGAAARTLTTGPGGGYDVLALAAGDYRLAFRLPGFATSVRTASVDAGHTTSVDVVLRVALNSDVLVSGPRTVRSLRHMGEPVNGLLGLAMAGSEGVVSLRQLHERPLARAGDLFEAVPGVLVSQHSGEGKANQYYVRGFNIDHGTDLASSVAGVPLNMPTHGHGQGYSDTNFLIPELVSGVRYRKGTYSVEEGDFAAAGAIDVDYASALDDSLLRLEAGPHRFGRVLLAGSSSIGEGRLLYAAEARHSDGPWVHPDGYRRLNGVLRYSRGRRHGGLSLAAMGYSGRWHSTDQVPRRAVESGRVDRFGTIDPSDRGETHRVSLSGEWQRSGARGLTEVKVYAVDSALDLFSNFTYFLDDPVNGDQFEQRDRRHVYGAHARQRFLGRWLGRETETLVGVQGRLDDIPTVGLYRARQGRRLATVREDDVRQRSGAAFLETTVQWAPRLRMVVGLRGDAYGFDVRSDDPANSGRRQAAVASPKLSVVLGPWKGTEVYANWGWGFHSNDARGAVQSRDPLTKAPVPRVDPIVRARGVELGVRTFAAGRYQGTLALWGLDVASELLFVGDAGTTEASRPSRRMGVEWSNVFTPTSWLTLDADVAFARARFRDADAAGDRIPGAVEGVVSAGVAVHERGRVSGGLRLRYVGPRPLVEDDSVRSQASTTASLRVGLRASHRLMLAAELFNLTDARTSDIDYYYVSRLPGEPAEGVADVHTHPLEPRTLRLSLTATF
jgi:hypothetical protein